MKKVFNLLIIIGLLIPIASYSQEITSENATRTASDTLRTSSSMPDDNNNSVQKKDKKGKKSKSSKKVTFETFDVNYAKALKFYENGQYLSAARLFEELYPLSLGTPNADTMLYLFADCYYKNKDYELAAFHFKDYAKHYPGTDRAEEAHYMCVKSVFEVSPVYSVDQSSTLFAIDELDLFIKSYPYSKHVEECNKMLDLLREKLAQKDFEIAKLYYNTDHFQAAQIAVKNFLKDYPSSKYADEAVFILIKNNHEFAHKSVNSKKRERYQACIDAFGIMRARFPDSIFYSDAKKLADDAIAQINKIKNQNKE
ncbi:MAG: outer membrane protein assembly factor BamD [Bacteroidales bacterium]|nr:outer membrane protein assembly factor BamD [Bacteroidales bacterium]